MQCCNCAYLRGPDSAPAMPAGEFWNLRDYYGITGAFCFECYRLVSHDAYGNPANPKQYAKIYARQHKTA